jgi:hypothetical protein
MVNMNKKTWTTCSSKKCYKIMAKHGMVAQQCNKKKKKKNTRLGSGLKGTQAQAWVLIAIVKLFLALRIFQRCTQKAKTKNERELGFKFC